MNNFSVELLFLLALSSLVAKKGEDRSHSSLMCEEIFPKLAVDKNEQ